MVAIAPNESPNLELRSYTFEFQGNLPPNATVSIHGNFDAVFGTGIKEDVHRGWNHLYPMDRTGNRFTATVDNLEVGKTYEYQIKISIPGQPDRYIPDAGRNNRIKIPPEEKTSNPDVITKKELTVLTKDFGDLLKAVSTHEGALGADAIVERIKLANKHKVGNRMGIFLPAVANLIASNRRYPKTIRDQFPSDNPPFTPEELRDRMREGALEFRKKVAHRLMADSQARKVLKVHEGKFPDESKRLCDEICHEFDHLFAQDYLISALEELAEEPLTDPNLTTQRQDHLKEVLKKIKPKDNSKEAPKERKEWWADVGTSLLGYGGMALDVGTFGTTVLGARAISEVLGVSPSDVYRAMKEKNALGKLWKKFLENNIGTKWNQSKPGEGGKVIKGRLWEVFKRTFFFGGAGKSVGEAAKKDEHGEHGKHGDEKQDEHEEHAKPEDIVRKACRAELET